MTFEEYQQVVIGRYNSLQDEEKIALEQIMETEVGGILEKVLGPEITRLSTPEQIPQQPAPEPMMQEPQRRPGLGARR